MRIAIYISSHGFGHATRMAALAEAFTQYGVELWLCTDRPGFLFQQLAPDSYHLRKVSIDRGVSHKDNLKTDLQATRDAIMQLFSHREDIVATELTFLRQKKIDLVIADIPFLIIEACNYAGIPVFGVSNFDWAFIYQDLFADDKDMQPILNVIWSLYRRMDQSYLVDLGSPQSVPGFKNPQKGGLLSRRLLNPVDIRSRYQIDDNQAILLVSFGGEGAMQIDMAKLCQAWDGVVLSSYRSPDIANLIKISPDEDFLSLIASSDLVLCKPGYSTFSEVLSQGKAMLYLPRENYPEEEVLIRGLNGYPAAKRVHALPDSTSDLRKLLKSVSPSDIKWETSNLSLCGKIMNDFFMIRYPIDRLISVFDLGSNNMNYILYNKSRDISLHRAWCTTALGRDFDGENLTDKSIDHGLMAITDIFDIDAQIDSAKHLITTGIHRKAKNSQALLDRISDKWKIKTKIISARKEMNLAWLASEAVSSERHPKMVMDIGGASTELAWSSGQNKMRGLSLDFGLQSLLRDYKTKIPALATVKASFQDLPDFDKIELVLIGLTATLLTRSILKISDYEALNLQHTLIDLSVLNSFIKDNIPEQDRRSREPSPGSIERDSIFLAACIVELLLDRYHSSYFMVCNNGISLGYAKWIK